jgi:hypothetical protein
MSSAAGFTITPAGTNLSENEFNNITLNATGGGAGIYDLSTRGLRWGLALTITDSSGGSTVLDKGTLTLTGGSIQFTGTSGTGITSTSGDVSIVTFNNQTSGGLGYIDFGSEAWTVTGSNAWDNGSTGVLSANWDAGTGTVTFSGAVAGTLVFAGANLAENEFNAVTFNSSAGTAQSFTMSTRDLRADSITVTDSSSTTELVVGTLNLSLFGDLTVGANGRLTMDGATATDFSFSATTGLVTLTTWTLYSTLNGGDIQWNFNPNTAGDTLTMTFGGLAPSTAYRLRRDGGSIADANSDGTGSVTFIVAGGWSAHDMRILPAVIGGGSPPPPTEPPFTPPPVVTDDLIPGALLPTSPFWLTVYVLLIGAGLYLMGVALKAHIKTKKHTKFWGLVLMIVSGTVLLLFYII